MCSAVALVLPTAPQIYGHKLNQSVVEVVEEVVHAHLIASSISFLLNFLSYPPHTFF